MYMLLFMNAFRQSGMLCGIQTFINYIYSKYFETSNYNLIRTQQFTVDCIKI